MVPPRGLSILLIPTGWPVSATLFVHPPGFSMTDASASMARSTGFRESWIQALTLSIKEPDALRVRPFFTAVDRLSGSGGEITPEAAAQTVWADADELKLRGALNWLPARQSPWTWDAFENFVFEPLPSAEAQSLDAWRADLGLAPRAWSLLARIDSHDWKQWVQDQAIQHRQNLSESLMTTDTNHPRRAIATWDDDGWHLRFEEAPWLRLDSDEAFSSPRPDMSLSLEELLFLVAEADQHLRRPQGPSAGPAIHAGETSWAESSMRLTPLHRAILDDPKSSSPWLRHVWCLAWPVVYREQNILRGAVSLADLRTQIAAAFAQQPKLMRWGLLFAKLVCQCQLRSGLGRAGDFA